MVDHSLAIQRFATRLQLTGLHEDGVAIGREVGRTVRELLPSAIGAALEPLLGGRRGVLRLDRIALRLRLVRSEISALGLCDRLAREIARAIAERAVGRGATHSTGAGFAYWPDHASYAAHYVALRLGLAPAPDWAFPDFRPLEHLASHESALELIAARPAILGALGRLVGASGAPALTASLPEPTAARLLERLATVLPHDLTEDAAEALAAMIAIVSASTETQPGRAAVAAATAFLAAAETAGEDRVRAVATLARLAVALVALRTAALAASGRVPAAADLETAARTHLPEPTRALLRAAMGALNQTEAVRTRLARLSGSAGRPHLAATPTAEAVKADTTTRRAITSRVAGIGLLMPSALAHGLADRLSPAAFSRTLAAAAGPRGEVAARLDPLLLALAPFDPRDADLTFPPVPDALRARVPEARREGPAEGEGAAAWAACLAHDFAAGLSGFEDSSLDYLRRQFLARPGTLHVAEGRLTLVLEPLPLGILLRLSGLNGWTGRLAQAGRPLLRIEIGEDRA